MVKIENENERETKVVVQVERHGERRNKAKKTKGGVA